MIQKIQIGDTVKIKNYCGSLNGKNATLLSIDGGYYLVKHGRSVAEIYRCEFDFVGRTKRGHDLAIRWNIKDYEQRIENFKKSMASAKRDLRKHTEMLNREFKKDMTSARRNLKKYKEMLKEG